MARLKLTSAAVDRIKPPEFGQKEYFDVLLPSFGVRVSYSGTKSWFVMTRTNGKLIRVTLGRYPALSSAEARTKAREAVHAASSGKTHVPLKPSIGVGAKQNAVPSASSPKTS